MRPIDADEFENFTRKNCADSLVDLWCELVRRQPTIEAAPVVHAEWIWKQQPTGEPFLYCSKCDELALCDKDGFQYESEVCPNCGAKMDGGKE